MPARRRALLVAEDASARRLGPHDHARPLQRHDAAAVGRLLAPYGFALTSDEYELAFTTRSAQGYLDAEWDAHPLAVAGLTILERQPGAADDLRARALAILEQANEADTGFRVTSRYVVVTARRG